ncbi:hypothetical protein DT076_14150 [Desertihabitans brevis]|uniref:Uncharacterized protein n=1 Tax=Desertihabitans brevis TaxID=2268447 RepID=A0A367YS61_9ACTN|nr:hypothetical protein DT076_14150 [Desertihabitans brevis]
MAAAVAVAVLLLGLLLTPGRTWALFSDTATVSTGSFSGTLASPATLTCQTEGSGVRIGWATPTNRQFRVRVLGSTGTQVYATTTTDNSILLTPSLLSAVLGARYTIEVRTIAGTAWQSPQASSRSFGVALLGLWLVC